MSWTRSSSIRSGLAQRARIVLLAADGVSNTEIAKRVGVARQTVIDWRAGYDRSGLAGLDDRPRSGRPRIVDRRRIIAATLLPPPRKYGVTHWSSRLLATHLKTSSSTVAKAWREVGVAPWRVETFKFSTDPELVAKVTDIVGLFVWTKTADQILAKAKRPTTTHSGHLPLAPNRVPRGGGDP